METTSRLTEAAVEGLVFDSTKGPFESEAIHDMPTAQEWYYKTREITIFDPKPKKDFATTYQLYYPEKPVEPWAKPEPELAQKVPFSGVSTYTAHYPAKEGAKAPPIGNPNRYESAPMIDKTTINQQEFTDPDAVQPRPHRETRPAAMLNPDDLEMYDIPTYMAEYPPKKVPHHKGPPADRTPQPYQPRDHTTTHNHFYVPKPLPEKASPFNEEQGTVPFLGDTTYREEFPPKPSEPVVTLKAPRGIKIPRPRMDLGVEKVIVDGIDVVEQDVFHVLIPALNAPPTKGRQVFTTVHDNQTQVSILVLHGFSHKASENRLLGQFDIINIPPMPKYTAKIEVTFFLNKDDILTAEARDLDGPRHKAWRAAGGAIVLRE